VVDHLSNWYVRLCRRRFWKGDYTEDKIAAYQTLYTCLEVVSKLASPIAPFYTDNLFKDLNSISQKDSSESVHLTNFPKVVERNIDADLEVRMDYAQKISSMVLSLRKKETIKVRQPLQKIMVPVLDAKFQPQVEAVKDLILSEVNIKEIEFLTDTSGVMTKNIKPNFKTIGPKYGKHMKSIAGIISQYGPDEISNVEKNNGIEFEINGNNISLELEDFEITSQDIPGYLVASEGGITVALDITITSGLKEEGIAREFINRIQNLRKDNGFDVVDKIGIKILTNEQINAAITNNKKYICDETLASSLEVVHEVNTSLSLEVEFEEGINTYISIEKLN
jgi:isoleucyl-tRNA synthetase